MSSAQIELIKQLRDRTGAGLMDCKKAIVACENDVEKAIVWLREKGLSKVAKKANRVAAEGKSWIEESGDDAVIFEVNSETDFVSESPAFGDLVKEIGKVLIEKKPATLEEATEMVSSICADGTMRMGEKIVLRRLKWIHKSAGENIGTYIHMKGKIAVAVVLKGGDKAFADDIAVSLCSSLPTYIFESEIPAEVVKKQPFSACASRDSAASHRAVCSAASAVPVPMASAQRSWINARQTGAPRRASMRRMPRRSSGMGRPCTATSCVTNSVVARS